MSSLCMDYAAPSGVGINWRAAEFLPRDREQSRVLHEAQWRVTNADPMNGRGIVATSAVRFHIDDYGFILHFESEQTRQAYLHMPVLRSVPLLDNAGEDGEAEGCISFAARAAALLYLCPPAQQDCRDPAWGRGRLPARAAVLVSVDWCAAGYAQSSRLDRIVLWSGSQNWREQEHFIRNAHADAPYATAEPDGLRCRVARSFRLSGWAVIAIAELRAPREDTRECRCTKIVGFTAMPMPVADRTGSPITYVLVPDRPRH